MESFDWITKLTWQEKTSAISLGMAFLAFLVSAKSLLNSNKSIKLALADHKEKKLKIQSYLIQTRRLLLESDIYTAFSISYTNAASIPNTLAKLELSISLSNDNRGAKSVFLQIEPKPPENISEFNALPLPVNIPARSSIEGWIFFKIPEYLHGKTIKEYIVLGTLASGESIQSSCYILMDTIYGQNRKI